MSPSLVHTLPESCATCQAQENCPFIRLPPQAFKQFQAMTQARLYWQGMRIFEQGQDAAGLFVIRSGSAKLSYIAASGKAAMLGLLGPGDVLGLAEIMAGGNYYAMSAEAFEDSALEFVAKDEFMPFLHANVTLALELLGALGRELHRLLLKLSETVGQPPAAERLLHILRRWTETCGERAEDGVRLRRPLTVQELADSIGYTRQWTSKLLRDLESQGLIRYQEGWITLRCR